MGLPPLIATFSLLAGILLSGAALADPVVDDACRKIGGKLSSVSVKECRKMGFSDVGARSVKGDPILLKEYPPLPGKTPRSRVLLIGGIHGDEYSSVSVVFKWMRILNRYHSGLFHWRIAPLLNPDGLLQRRSQRINAHGVDLNRNFPSPDWKRESDDYWVRRTGRDPRRFPGTGPLSEPESAWLAQEIDHFKPDVIISIHAPFGVLDFDGPPATPPEKLGSLYLSLLGTYPGSLGRYAGVHMGIPVITIELPYAGIMPSRGEVRKIWIDLVRWLLNNPPETPRWRAASNDAPKQTAPD